MQQLSSESVTPSRNTYDIEYAQCKKIAFRLRDTYSVYFSLTPHEDGWIICSLQRKSFRFVNNDSKPVFGSDSDKGEAKRMLHALKGIARDYRKPLYLWAIHPAMYSYYESLGFVCYRQDGRQRWYVYKDTDTRPL